MSLKDTHMLLQADLALKVPKHEKDEAKALGVRPCYIDEKFSHWFAPKNKDAMPFRKWWPNEFKSQMIEAGVIEAEEISLAPIESQSLSAVLTSVKNVVAANFKAPIWIRAEIINISSKGHTYLELSDYDKSGSENGKASGMIWSNDHEIISNFREKTGLDLKAGMKILFQAVIEFNERYGLKLGIVNIDPGFTLGDMEVKIESIRNKLITDGHYSLNKNLSRPFDFFKVAVISPADAAGLGDFRTQADAIEAAGLCRFRYLSATFSGNDCAKSITTALGQASRWASQIDAVVIIRGGGDKAGLYALNELEIVEAVCKLACPVIVGIGHERDNTLLDEVANIRCATPSLVIGHISSVIIKNAQDCKNNMFMVNKMATENLVKARAKTDQIYNEVRDLAFKSTAKARSNCDMTFSLVQQNAMNTLSVARQTVKSMMQEVFINNPLNVLNRGYTIVKGPDTQVITSKEDALNQNVTIMFKDGSVSAQISNN
jgi:exodeoxyribonuclease VII large subunit